ATPDLEELRERVAVELPAEEAERLALAVPPIPGAEYVDAALVARWWREMEAAFREEVAHHDGTVQSWLQARDPAWSLVGPVFFLLAENKSDPSHPFAFMATFTTKLSSKSKAQHLPLARALADAKGNRSALLTLLVPVSRAAAKSALAAE